MATVDEVLGHIHPKRIAEARAEKVTIVGTDTYIALAVPGTAEDSPVWQVRRVSILEGTTRITWADGDALFDNLATDLTELAYS